MNDFLNQRLELLLDNFVREENIPSLEFAISDSRNDFLKFRAGIHVNKNESYNTGFLYLGASIAKTIASFSIYYLACNNEISLDDRVVEIIPSLRNCSNIDNNIRILDLLTHSSGIIEVSYDWINKTNHDISSLESFESGLYKFTIDHNKRGQFLYGNIGYDIIGAVIEKITNSTYDTFVCDNIFKPININNSYFKLEKIPKVKLSTPHHKTKNELLPVSGYPKALRHNPSAVFYATVSDLTQFGRLHLNSGRHKDTIMISSECYDFMWSPIVNTPYKPNKYYGIGWFIGEIFGGIPVYGHGGREYGFNSLLIVCPYLEITFSILMNVHRAKTLKLAGHILRILFNHRQQNRLTKEST